MAPSAISPDRHSPLNSASSLKTAYHDTLRFFLNGTRVALDDIDPEITLLEYLRGIGLTGTKLYGLRFSPCPQSQSLRLTCADVAQWLRRGRLWCLHRCHKPVEPHYQAHLSCQRQCLPGSLGQR